MSLPPDDFKTDSANEPSPLRFLWPVLLVTAPPATLMLLCLVLMAIQHDYVATLWQRPMGMRMLVWSFLLASIGEITLLALVLVRIFVLGPHSRRWLRVGHVVLVVVILITCFAPAVFVLLIGPAAIQIQENLSSP